MAPASSCVSAAPAAQLHPPTGLRFSPTLEPESYLDCDTNIFLLSSSSSTVESDTSLMDFPKPPDLFSSRNFSNPSGKPGYTLLHTREPGRSCVRENTSHYCPFRGQLTHSSPLSPLYSTSKALSSQALLTVASEPTLLTDTDTNASPIPALGSHLPHFPCSPYKHSSQDTVLIHGPAPSSSLPPPQPPPPCPTGPGEAAAWACCCSLGGAAMPLSRYLGKVGHAALPLLKVGGLLNAEPSDVQT